MAIKNNVSIYFDPRLSIVKSVFDCRLSGVLWYRLVTYQGALCCHTIFALLTYFLQWGFQADERYSMIGLNIEKKGSRLCSLICDFQVMAKKSLSDSSSTTTRLYTFSCSYQLGMKLIMLTNVKMPTIVGILTFVIMKIATSKSLEVRNFFNIQHFSIYEHWKVHAQLSMKMCMW